MSAVCSSALSAVSDLPVHKFDGSRQAVSSIASYCLSLQARAADRRSRGFSVSDQDYSEEVFCLMPRGAVGRPLALIGGMGPLAGALAFRRACERFGNSRSTVLYQACSIPDRTAVILADRGVRRTTADLDMASRLAYAIYAAVELLPHTAERVDCIMACNSVHYFWELLKSSLARSPRLAERLNLISTVKCSLRALRLAGYERTLMLSTDGARVGRLFSSAATEAGIRFWEPAQGLNRLLMKAIYEGVKSLDQHRAVAFGTQLFEGVAQYGPFDCVLAACTELPSLIELLKEQSTPAVRAFLSRVTVVDPFEAALDAAATAGAEGRGNLVVRSLNRAAPKN